MADYSAGLAPAKVKARRKKPLKDLCPRAIVCRRTAPTHNCMLPSGESRTPGVEMGWKSATADHADVANSAANLRARATASVAFSL
ncbi:hypothetical protein JCM17478_02250 [Thermopirellula anaerolimosa]